MDAMFWMLNYRYLALGLGTIIDHSGVPTLITLAGVLTPQGYFDPLPALVVANIAILIGDAALFVCGDYIRRGTVPVQARKIIDRMVNPFLNGVDAEVQKHALLCFGIGKFVPIVGKFLPAVLGYHGHPLIPSLLKLLPGNVLYSVCFYAAGCRFGEIMLRESRWISLGIIALLFLLYFMIEKRMAAHIIKKESVNAGQ